MLHELGLKILDDRGDMNAWTEQEKLDHMVHQRAVLRNRCRSAARCSAASGRSTKPGRTAATIAICSC